MPEEEGKWPLEQQSPQCDVKTPSSQRPPNPHPANPPVREHIHSHMRHRPQVIQLPAFKEMLRIHGRFLFYQQLRPEHRLSHHRLIRSEEHTSELQSLMRISYAVFCLKTKNT